MMKLILFRSNNIFDSRVNKYHNYYERASIDYTIVGWDRKCEGISKKNYDFFRYSAGEAVGGFKAVKNHLRWMIFVFKYLKNHRDVTTIHACDLNSAFPAAIFKMFYKRDVVLIFDACDWFSANFSNYKLLNIIFGVMERIAYISSNELIICEPERVSQIQFKLKKEPLVMRNIPDVDLNSITVVQDRFKFDNDNPTIAYMGGFAQGRFLLELLKLSETESFNLLIAGSGDKNIVEECIKADKRPNVRYFGRVSMVDGLNMENAADVIYAMYCKVNPNHIYAAPNKYYEAMLLGKPLITTKGTIPGNNVERHQTGWAVEEDIDEMRMLIRKFSMDDINIRGRNALDLWNYEFKYSIPNFFDKTYTKIIK